MLVYVIRHADTVQGRDDVFRGRADVPLSDLGRAQAAACARALSSERLEAVYCGPLSRARDTGAAIAAPHGLEPIVEPAFDDVHIGDWEGLTLDEVATRWPRQWSDWRLTPHTFVFPGGERLDDVRHRAWSALRATTAAAVNGNGNGNGNGPAQRRAAGRSASGARPPAIAIVTHRAVAKLLLLAAVDAPTSSFWRISQNPCALNLLELRSDGNYTIRRVNDTSHIM